MAGKEPEIKFPVDWDYRVIVETAKADAYDKIIAVLKEYGINVKPEKDAKSSGGKYQAYQIPVIFDSREMMDSLSSKLAAVDGVKFIL